MMKMRVIIALLFLTGVLPLEASVGSPYHSLDSLIRVQDKIIAARTRSIEAIKRERRAGMAMPQEYKVNERLYREYVDFQNDSAQRYVRRNIEIARLLGDNDKLTDSRLMLMHLLAKAYMPEEAQRIVEQLDTTTMSSRQKLDYYKSLSDIYLFKLEYYTGSAYEKEYRDMMAHYHGVIASLAQEGSELKILYQASHLDDVGKTSEAITLLENMLKHYRSGERTFSIITSTLAYYYTKLGDRDKPKRLLAMSAASDIEGCIMENSALRQLANLLFDEGDIDRAYRYINLSVADATFYGTRLRNVQSSQLVPRIISSYQREQENNYRRLLLMIVALSVLASMLVAGIIALTLLYKRYRRLSESRKAINDELHHTVAQLRERDKIKEQYLGRFLTFSSMLIDKNEQQRKNLNRLAMEDKMRELKSQLKSPQHYYESAKLFYQNFDSAFLNIYPNFIEEVNALLTAEGRIETKEDEQLTRELRILALLRLGITSNKEIASILRASIATVYTYRSRLKTRALNKDTFEDDVTSIHSESNNP